jgi:uncharacterized protein (TIGR02246 family)
VTESPIERLLAALDKLDVDAALAMFAPDGRFLTADGRRAEGTDALRALLTSFLGALRSTAHTITAQWHQDNVWIAEVEANYVLTDHLQISALPRAFVLRDGPHGISDLRVYGAHEHQLAENDTNDEGLWIGGRWIPPL